MKYCAWKKPRLGFQCRNDHANQDPAELEIALVPRSVSSVYFRPMFTDPRHSAASISHDPKGPSSRGIVHAHQTCIVMHGHVLLSPSSWSNHAVCNMSHTTTISEGDQQT